MLTIALPAPDALTRRCIWLVIVIVVVLVVLTQYGAAIDFSFAIGGQL
ncbi:hypothetical protein GCM10010156_38580 [Planobispora rosea]|uniref:Uncharacterized protein n=1 Tax=Planobispora rosea TaxID=35762 RepID=A0A8J3S521_PLARO|nr:hypothetical protein [Planobispora rosea]GGS76109.1 hypothetical protein GCM10010156_38580 [Planobispora rosea]GIH86260.1 hypothetical protein Pro02_46680 [Planobispora rosea]